MRQILREAICGFWDTLIESFVIAYAIIVAFLLAGMPADGAELRGIRVIDGDTVHADVVDLGWGAALTDQSIRLLGYDAPEISKRRRAVKVTDEEIQRGKAAKARLEELIGEAQVVYLYEDEHQPKRDPYGRMLGVMLLLRNDGKMIDVCNWMSTEGHVRFPDREVPPPAPPE